MAYDNTMAYDKNEEETRRFDFCVRVRFAGVVGIG